MIKAMWFMMKTEKLKKNQRSWIKLSFLKEKVKPFITPFNGLMGKSQAPLPPTPGVNPQLVTQATQNITPTGLTQTETALLSNEEKAIRLRQRGLA